MAWIPAIGTRIRVRKQVERSDFIVPIGMTGTVSEVNEDGHDIWAKFDQPIQGAEEWDNSVQWYSFNSRNLVNDEAAPSIFWADVEVIPGGVDAAEPPNPFSAWLSALSNDPQASIADTANWDGYSLWLVNDGQGGSEKVRVPAERTADEAIAYALSLPKTKLDARRSRQITAELLA